MPTELPLGLYPKKHTLCDQGNRTVFRALSINALEDKFEETYDNITKAFCSGDPRLSGINLVPIRPTLKFNMNNIVIAAQGQNAFIAELSHLTVRGIKKLDSSMDTRAGGKLTMREHFESYFVDSEGNNQQLIHQTERATDGRVF